MEHFNPNCPNCGEKMVVHNLGCGACGINLQGEMELPKLAQLTSEDREFVELFVLASGSLKEVGKALGLSYPTVRSRLDQVIKSLQDMNEARLQERLDILDQLEKGDISPQDAVKLLEKIKQEKI